jgi:hypothetical protein
MTRLIININDESADFILRQKSAGVTATETVRRALSVYEFMLEAERDGRQLQTVARNGDITHVTLIR